MPQKQFRFLNSKMPLKVPEISFGGNNSKYEDRLMIPLRKAIFYHVRSKYKTVIPLNFYLQIISNIKL